MRTKYLKEIGFYSGPNPLEFRIFENIFMESIGEINLLSEMGSFMFLTLLVIARLRKTGKVRSNVKHPYSFHTSIKGFFKKCDFEALTDV